jgi:HK97 family phage prohead protease
MPIKPGKDESQSDWMARCVPEMMGQNGGTKRPNDQAVAACSTMWRDAKGGKKPPSKDFADTGYQADGKQRFPLDEADQIRVAWHAASKPDIGKLYTDEQMRRIRSRITAAWKEKIDLVGPPSIDDKAAMAVLRNHLVRAAAPDPDPDESHDDFIERCEDEMSDSDMDDDEIEEACQLAWEQSDGEDRAGPVMFKTHATPNSGMEFVLSDSTPDRFGDIVEPKGFDISAFKNNPIALFGHDKMFVIGKWANVRISDDDLRGDLVLAPKGTSPRIDEIRKLVEADILRAVSVGFKPKEHEPINKKDPWGGTRFISHELVEASLVAVPANPNALAVAKSLNVSPTTLRLAFGEHADMGVRHRDFRGEHADKRSKQNEPTGEHAEAKRGERKEKPMLLSQRIQDGEKRLLAFQDQRDKHIEAIDDDDPTDEQMLRTEELSSQIERQQRHLASLKALEAKNGSGASDSGEMHRSNNGGGISSRPPAGLTLRASKKPEPLDYLWRAALIRCRSKAEGADIDAMRQKVYGDDEVTRVVCDMVLKAASAPAMTTVAGWAQELVQTIWAQFMEALHPVSVYPKLEGMGLALSFGASGRIIIPTRNLTPAVSGSFVGEGAPIPVRQTAFASQTLVPKKMAVIVPWTREMGEHSIPAIEGLLRQAVLDDTAVALDTVLLDNNVATAIRPPGLRSYQAGLTPSALTPGFNAFVADYRALYGSLLTLTLGNVRKPALLLNPQQAMDLSTMQPPAAAAPLWPLAEMVNAGRIGKAALIESATVPNNMAIMVDAADFTSVGSEGPRMEISDTATLHFEDTTPADIVSGPTGTPVAATPVKSLWQTDSLALRLILPMNFVMRRPVVAWMTSTAWGS